MVSAGRRDGDHDGHEAELDAGRSPQLVHAAVARAGGQPPSDDAAGEEARDGHQ